MKKQSILITGASSGIGKALAIQYHNLGWFVGLLDINETALNELQTKFGAENCFVKQVDITNTKQLNDAVTEFATHTNNQLDVLAANAGIIVQKPFYNGSQKDYEKLIGVNAFGSVNTIYSALPLLKNTTGARIVITSSSSAMYGIPDFAVYSATKGFLRNLTEALNIELQKQDIWVSDVMPLFVQTNMMNDIEQKYVASLTPEKVAQAIQKATKNKKIHNIVGKGMRNTYLAHKFLPIKWFKAILKRYLNYK